MRGINIATRHCILIFIYAFFRIVVDVVVVIVIFICECCFHVETKESEYQRRPIIHAFAIVYEKKGTKTKYE